MNSPKNRTVLFLCTGNYYRSRFAEEFFNHLAKQANLPWAADSAALGLELGVHNVGPIAPNTLEALSSRAINPLGAERLPRAVSENDFENAELVVALKETEHRPYIENKYSRFNQKIRYWAVNDVPPSATYSPCDEIERLVRELISELE